MTIKKEISPECYFGMLLAEQDAGGCLTFGAYGIKPSNIVAGDYYKHNSVFAIQNGESRCGCIHGAAFMAGGKTYGKDFSLELSKNGLEEKDFDSFAFAEINAGRCVTVDSTLEHFGIEVAEKMKYPKMESEDKL